MHFLKNNSHPLLIIWNPSILHKAVIEKELEVLNKVLSLIDSLNYYTIVHEVIDINRYRIIYKPSLVSKVLSEKRGKPFIFIFNKN